ncbi:MAG: hypothetical protein H6730_02075 [Deltaproteobacteria bacterium]|nr:hypothetical protein [Deltaproteobacteria bacterium]
MVKLSDGAIRVEVPALPEARPLRIQAGEAEVVVQAGLLEAVVQGGALTRVTVLTGRAEVLRPREPSLSSARGETWARQRPTPEPAATALAAPPPPPHRAPHPGSAAGRPPPAAPAARRAGDRGRVQARLGRPRGRALDRGGGGLPGRRHPGERGGGGGRLLARRGPDALRRAGAGHPGVRGVPGPPPAERPGRRGGAGVGSPPARGGARGRGSPLAGARRALAGGEVRDKAQVILQQLR